MALRLTAAPKFASESSVMKYYEVKTSGFFSVGFWLLLAFFTNFKTAQTVPKETLQKLLRNASFNMAIFSNEFGAEFSVVRYHPASCEGSFAMKVSPKVGNCLRRRQDGNVLPYVSLT